MIDSLSYSSINLYLTCAESWRKKYLLKQPQPSSPALLFGSVFHGTVEESIGRRGMEDDTKPLIDIWRGIWGLKMEQEGSRVEWGTDTPEQHYNEGIRIFGTPEVQKLIDSITPLTDEAGVFMERQVEFRVPGVPVPVIGYVDILTSDGVPGDFKTSSARWTQERAQAELQPLFYLAALHQAGRTVPGLRFRHYVVTKTKRPEVQVLEHSHTWSEIFWLYELIRRVWDGINREVFTVNPHSWLC